MEGDTVVDDDARPGTGTLSYDSQTHAVGKNIEGWERGDM